MNRLGMDKKGWEIFTCAVDLFSEKGYDVIALRDIVDCCGLNYNTFLKYFTSKEELLEMMYKFYNENFQEFMNDFNNFLPELIGLSVKEALIKIMSESFYSKELQPYMDKIYYIAVLRNKYDKDAFEIYWGHTFLFSMHFMKQLLYDYIKEEKIEPMDVEAFVELYCSYTFSTVFRQTTKQPLKKDIWERGIKQLLSIIIEK